MNNRKRFYDEFKEHDYIKPKISKPGSLIIIVVVVVVVVVVVIITAI